MKADVEAIVALAAELSIEDQLWVIRGITLEAGAKLDDIKVEPAGCPHSTVSVRRNQFQRATEIRCEMAGCNWIALYPDTTQALDRAGLITTR